MTGGVNLLNVLVLRIRVTSQGHCDTRCDTLYELLFFFFLFVASSPKLVKAERDTLHTHTSALTPTAEQIQLCPQRKKLTCHITFKALPFTPRCLKLNYLSFPSQHYSLCTGSSIDSPRQRHRKSFKLTQSSAFY